MNAFYEQDTGQEMVQINNPIVNGQVISRGKPQGKRLITIYDWKCYWKDNCWVLELPKVGELISEDSEKLLKKNFHVSWYLIIRFSCREKKMWKRGGKWAY